MPVAVAVVTLPLQHLAEVLVQVEMEHIMDQVRKVKHPDQVVVAVVIVAQKMEEKEQRA